MGAAIDRHPGRCGQPGFPVPVCLFGAATHNFPGFRVCGGRDRAQAKVRRYFRKSDQAKRESKMAGVYPPAIQNRGVAGGSNAQFSLLLAWLHCGRLRLCRRFWCFHDCCPEKVWRGGRGHDCPIGTRQNNQDLAPALRPICGGEMGRVKYFLGCFAGGIIVRFS